MGYSPRTEKWKPRVLPIVAFFGGLAVEKIEGNADLYGIRVRHRTIE